MYVSASFVVTKTRRTRSLTCVMQRQNKRFKKFVCVRVRVRVCVCVLIEGP